MQLGTVQHTFRGQTTDLDRFKKAKEIGYAGVEPDLSVADLDDVSNKRLDSIRAARDATGLAVPSLCIGAHNSEGLVFATWRGDKPAQEIRKAVDWCEKLGAKVLLVPFFFFNEPRNAAQRKRVVDVLTPLCKEAQDKGVRVAYEGLLTATQLWQIAAGIRSSAFGVYFDPGNAAWIDLDPAAELRALHSLVAQVHFKDSKDSTGDARIGTGKVDYPELVRALHDIKYDGWVVTEAFGVPDEAARADFEAASRFLGSSLSSR